MVTVSGQAGEPIPALQEYLPPCQTLPFNLMARKELDNAAAWDEELVIDEAIERLVALDTLLIFEVRHANTLMRAVSAFVSGDSSLVLIV